MTLLQQQVHIHPLADRVDGLAINLYAFSTAMLYNKSNNVRHVYNKKTVTQDHTCPLPNKRSPIR